MTPMLICSKYTHLTPLRSLSMTIVNTVDSKIIMRYKRIGYNLYVMRQSACLVINPITVDGYAALFNCTPVNRASDSMMAPTLSYYFSWLGPELSSVAWSTGAQLIIFFCFRFFSGVV